MPHADLPDCMMPDGAEPCMGYQRIRDENADLRARNAEMLRTFGSSEIERLRAEIEELKQQIPARAPENE